MRARTTPRKTTSATTTPSSTTKPRRLTRTRTRRTTTSRARGAPTCCATRVAGERTWAPRPRLLAACDSTTGSWQVATRRAPDARGVSCSSCTASRPSAARSRSRPRGRSRTRAATSRACGMHKGTGGAQGARGWSCGSRHSRCCSSTPRGVRAGCPCASACQRNAAARCVRCAPRRRASDLWAVGSMECGCRLGFGTCEATNVSHLYQRPNSECEDLGMRAWSAARQTS